MLENVNLMTSDNIEGGEDKPPNPPRLITRDELAMLCRIQRHFRGWSPETWLK